MSFEKRDNAIAESSVNNADRLLEKGMEKEALTIYKEVVKEVSGKSEPVLFSHIKHQEGHCYYKLALVSNKEDNLTKSIHAYEEALKIRTLEKYPVDYAMTQNNLGNAYRDLSGVRNKEDNLTKSILACEEALKIRTLEKYPENYRMLKSNIDLAKKQIDS
jgi:tetratricopeptide (TPR) repeat protein